MTANLKLVHPAPGMTDLALDVTIFGDVKAQQPKAIAATWGAVVQEFAKPSEHASKEACPLLVMGTFGDKHSPKGSLRHDANLLNVTGVVGDYDGEKVGIDEAARRLKAAGLEALVYSTARHSDAKPRWRVLAPLSTGHAPEDHTRLVDVLNGALGGILTPESWTRSQSYYVGRVAGVPYRCERITGTCLDLLAAIDLIVPIGKALADKPAKPAAGAPDPFAVADRQRTLGNVTAQTLAELAAALEHLATKTARATVYKEWIDTGEALACLKGSPFEAQAAALWDKFSASAPDKYDPAQARDKWAGFAPDRITYRSIFEWAQAAGWQNPQAAAARSFDDLVDWTDAGNANLLRQLVDGNLRYIVDRAEWLFWDGAKWLVDVNGAHAHRQALRVSEHYMAKAAELQGVDPGSDEERKRIARRVDAMKKWAHSCRSRKLVSAMLEFLSKSEGVAIETKELDRDPLLLGVQNGVVDLRTGALRPAGRDDFVTKRCAAAYDPAAKAPTWERAVAEITGAPLPGEGIPARFKPRPGIASYVQRVFGHVATGLTTEHKMFFFHGDGSNGKNLLTDVACNALGDYAAVISVKALMSTQYASDGDKATPTLARLVGVRGAFCSETGRGQKLDAAIVKAHTGDSILPARQNYGAAFDFRKTHKLVMLGNHAPAFDSDETALHGRIHRVEFLRRWNRPDDVKHDPALPDGEKGLLERIVGDEAAGVLAWIVRGASEYLRAGLGLPDEVRAATLSYFAEQGRVAKWASGWARCAARHGTRAAELLADYQRATGDTATTAKAFGIDLAALGIEYKAREDGRYWGLCRPAAPFQPIAEATS